jgi:hypothetical protein
MLLLIVMPCAYSKLEGMGGSGGKLAGGGGNDSETTRLVLLHSQNEYHNTEILSEQPSNTHSTTANKLRGGGKQQKGCGGKKCSRTMCLRQSSKYMRKTLKNLRTITYALSMHHCGRLLLSYAA